MDSGILGTETLTEIIKSLCIREDDVRLTKFRKYYEIGKDVYRELNLYSIRFTKRYLIEVDRKTRSVKVPPQTLLISSVSVIDDCGKIIPLVLNNNIYEDFVDISQAHSCGCDCGCDNELCGLVKTYETVIGKVSAPLPDGTMKEFDTYSRKTIYPNGDYFHEYSIPVTIMEDGEHVDTQLQEKKEFICKLEMEECGCVKNSHQNKSMLDSCCGPNDFYTDCGCKISVPKTNETFGMVMEGDRINFDSSFPYTHVLVRVYLNEAGGDVRIPLVAKKALIYGIKVEENPFEPVTGYSALAQQRRQNTFEFKYEREKKKLFRLLNRLSLKNILRTLIPARKMV